MSRTISNDFREEFAQCANDPLCALSLRRAFLLLLQFHYNDPNNYGAYVKNRLECLRWSPDPKLSKIAISLSGTSTLQDSGEGVQIDIDIGDMTFTKKVIGNTESETADLSGETEILIAQANLIVTHIAPTPDTALALAESTASFLFGFRKNMMRHIKLTEYDLVQQTKPVRTKNLPDANFKVDVVAKLGFTYGVQTNVESHRIKEFAMQYQAGLSALTT